MTSPISDKWRAAVCCFLGLWVPLMSYGADLFYMDHDILSGQYTGPVGSLVMSGDIEPGDYDRLLAKIAENPPRFIERNTLIVASEGGDANEAMKIAGLIKALHTQILVGPLTGRCADVCFLIYVVADQRGTDGSGLIGIRGTPQSQTSSVGDFLRANEVSAEFLTRVLKPPSDGVYWLEDNDETHLGTRSPAFMRYLVAHCHWDDQMERDVRSAKRPLADMNDMWACRRRVTQSDAAATLKERSSTHR